MPKTNLHEAKRIIYEHCHSVQGPLNTIDTIAMLMSEMGVSAEVSEEIKRIRRITSHLRIKTSALAMVANIENGSLTKVPLYPIEVEEIVRCVMAIFSEYAELFKDRAEITYEIDDGKAALAACCCLAEFGLLRHLLNEIIENAFQFSARESVIRARFSTTASHLIVEITNRGLILSQDDAKHTDERGWRSEGAKLSTASGSGLGLWTASSVGRILGAKIRVRPTDHLGDTVVTIEFPTTQST